MTPDSHRGVRLCSMEHPDFLVIGHAAKDLNDGGYQWGGTVLYSALTARNLGLRVGVITSGGPDLDLEQSLGDIETICVPSAVTTTFRNLYGERARHQHVLAVADGIKTEDVPLAWRKVPIVHLGPIAREIKEDMISLFPSSLLGLTPQGWLRQWDAQGRVFPCPWKQVGNLLPLVDVLVVSEEDLAGEAGALRSYLDIPSVSVVTEGEKGVTLHYHGRSSHFPARKARSVDPTGAGDVFASAFLVRFSEIKDPHEAARFANVAASLSVEKVGVASVPGRAQIETLVTNKP